jgi:hypothetical protein
MTFLVFSVFPAPDSPLRVVSEDSVRLEADLRNQDALVLAFVDEVAESLVGHCEDMRLRLLATSAPVHVDVLTRVYGQGAVWVDGDQKEARVSLHCQPWPFPSRRHTYIYKVRLISHVEVVDDRGLVQMRELCHVVGLVELGWIDLVYRVGIHLLLGSIVALDQQPPLGQVLDDPAADKGRRGVPQPDIALPGEVVLALDDTTQRRRLLAVLGYKQRRESAGWRAVAVRLGAHPRVAAAQHGAAEIGERLVAQVAHLEVAFGERRRDETRLWARGRGRARRG